MLGWAFSHRGKNGCKMYLFLAMNASSHSAHSVNANSVIEGCIKISLLARVFSFSHTHDREKLASL